jgi:hypothetical protein
MQDGDIRRLLHYSTKERVQAYVEEGPYRGQRSPIAGSVAAAARLRLWNRVVVRPVEERAQAI